MHYRRALALSVLCLLLLPTAVGIAAAYRQIDPQELRNFGLIPSARPPATPNGRKLPDLVIHSDLGAERLRDRAVPLLEADTHAGINFFEGRFGSVLVDGREQLFNPEVILVKFRNDREVRALRVEPLRESDAIAALRKRADVEFAEIDFYQQRQFVPNDPDLSNQWHHAVIGSYVAWNVGLGEPAIRIAIVDAPFQMDHPDLAAHTDPGWDVVTGTAVLANNGIHHSTFTAGMAAAVIGNGVGVAGASNCRIVPININGAISEMNAAIRWAADHGIRVVNISWTGAYSDTLNSAGEYLKTTAAGVLAMAGVNGSGFLNYTNQPNIYAISMTDTADTLRSRFGDHIDFAAPGWEVYSTTTVGGYRTDSGTSYSTPLFCGVAAVLMSINPTLNTDEIIQLFKDTAYDLGTPGWDQSFGWGRIDFAAAAAAAQSTAIRWLNGQPVITIPLQSGLIYELWKSPQVESPAWGRVTNAVLMTNGPVLTLIDPAPAANKGFYRVRIQLP